MLAVVLFIHLLIASMTCICCQVLATPDEDAPDPFDETYKWGERVKRKYQSLVVQARKDPKLALDSQYDKRATFIRIIDEVGV